VFIFGVPNCSLSNFRYHYCFRKTSNYDFAVQQGALYWINPPVGKITRIPHIPLYESHMGLFSLTALIAICTQASLRLGMLGVISGWAAYEC
jgi:hypothetical protein